METLTVKTTVQTSIEEVWECWTMPYHITKWNISSNDWNCSSASNDLVKGGKFSWRMESKDGRIEIDFSGTYEEVDQFKTIRKKLNDGRSILISFKENNGSTEITKVIEPQNIKSDSQIYEWQAILNSFNNYIESIR